MLIGIHTLMAHIPFAVEAANGYQYISVGTVRHACAVALERAFLTDSDMPDMPDTPDATGQRV